MMNNFSTTGYKDNSPDKDRSHNLIPGNIITMKGVSKKLILVPIIGGKPRYDQKIVANPGDSDIQFGSDVESVLELPFARNGLMVNPYLETNLDTPPLVPPTTIPGVAPMMNQAPPTQDDYLKSKQAQFDQQQIDNNFADPTGPLPYNPSLYSTQSIQSPLSLGVDPNEAQKVEMKKVTEAQNKPFVGALNPYGGWNMQTASTALGAFIQDKNPLGIVGAAGKILLEGTRNAMSGAAAYKTYREGQAEYEDDLEQQERRSGFTWLQKGGKVGKMLTGNFIEGNEDHPDPSVEVEKGEYLQTPDGGTMEVLGDKHSEGGELLDMPGGTKVISDYLKIGGKLAKFFKEEYGLNVRAGSSFATVLDQYKKKLGLTKLLEEEADLMGKIADQEKVEFQGTREINLQVLSGKVQELKPQKQELEQRFEVFTNLVFDKQEQTKEPGQNNFEKQQGGEVDDPALSTSEDQPIPQESAQEGQGSDLEQIILTFAQMTGEDPAQIVQQLQQLPEEQIQQAIQEMVQVIQEQGQQEQGMAPQEGQEPMMRRGGNIQYAQKGLETMRKWIEEQIIEPNHKPDDARAIAAHFKPLLEERGIDTTGMDEADIATLGTQYIGKMQQYDLKNTPGLANDYSRNIWMTRKGLATSAGDKEYMKSLKEKYPSLYAKVAKSMAPDGSVKRGSYDTFTEQERKDLLSNLDNTSSDFQKKFTQANYYDNEAYFRGIRKKEFEFDNEAEYNKFIDENKDKMIDGWYKTDKTGVYVRPVFKPNGSTTPPATSETQDPSADIVPPANRARDYQNRLPILTPDQSNLPPSLLQPGLRQIGMTQANAIRISPEETLRELNRQYSTATDAIMENNPYTAGAAQANLQAQTNNSINQAYSQAAVVNAQDERNVQNTNEQRIQQMQEYNIGAMNDYEKLSQAAVDNYATSWRNFIDKKNLENVNNYNLQQQVNASNAVNPNYQIGAHGEIYQTEEPVIFYLNGRPMMRDPKTGEEYEVIKKTDNKGNSSVTEKTGTYNNTRNVKGDRKQKGGLLLSRDIKKWLK